MTRNSKQLILKQRRKIKTQKFFGIYDIMNENVSQNFICHILILSQFHGKFFCFKILRDFIFAGLLAIIHWSHTKCISTNVIILRLHIKWSTESYRVFENIYKIYDVFTKTSFEFQTAMNFFQKFYW